MSVPIFSLCITSFSRPDELATAVESCRGQGGEDLEIIIGDDTPNGSTENAINQRFLGDDRIRFIRNDPPLGQAANVDNLFRESRGEWLILLHDDDYLEPNALSIYREQIEKYADGDMFFGKQFLANSTGKESFERSEDFNRIYGRDSSESGPVGDAVKAVLASRIPNNGYCVRASRAKKPGYPGIAESGDACDWAFGARLAMEGATFVYIDEYVSTYVVSESSVTRAVGRNDSAMRAVKIVERHFADRVGSPEYFDFFRGQFPRALSQSIEQNERDYAKHLISFAWNDKRMPKTVVAKQFARFCVLSIMNRRGATSDAERHSPK